MVYLHLTIAFRQAEKRKSGHHLDVRIVNGGAGTRTPVRSQSSTNVYERVK